MCATVTPMGYLSWHMSLTPPLPIAILWFLYIASNAMINIRPVKKALAISAYGLVCLLCSWSLTDEMNSNWCLYVTGYALLGLVDFHVDPFDAHKKAQHSHYHRLAASRVGAGI